MTPTDYLTTIRTAIRKDQIDIALKLLRELLDGSEQINEAIAQSGRYAAIKKEIRRGTIDGEGASVEKNNLRFAILDFLTELEIEEMEDPIVKKATEQAASTPIYHQYAEKIYNIDHIDNANFS